MNKRKLAFVALVLVLLGAGYGFYHHQQQQEKPLTLYGNVDIRTVNLAFRVGGRVAELNVDEDDAVQTDRFNAAGVYRRVRLPDARDSAVRLCVAS